MIEKLTNLLLQTCGLIAVCAGNVLAADFSILSSTMNKTFEEAGKIRQVELRMPYIKMSDADIAQPINDQLYIYTLGYYAPDNYIPGLTNEGDHIAFIRDLSHELVYQNERRLAIKVASLFCRPTCFQYAEYFNFDLRNGHKIDLHEVLQPETSKMMERVVLAELRKRYRRQIDLLQDEIRKLKSGQYRGDRKLKYLQDSLRVNKDCLASIKAKLSPMEFFKQYALTSRFFDDHVEFTNRWCTSPDERYLDKVATTDFTFSYTSLRPWMTAYGRTVLLNEGDAMGTDWRGQILYGSMGKESVKMRADETNKSGLIHYSGNVDIYGGQHQSYFFMGAWIDSGQFKLISLPDSKRITINLRQTGNTLSGEYMELDEENQVTNNVQQIKLRIP